MESYQKTYELLKQLVASKQKLADTLTDKGEEASLNDPFDELVEKAGDYVPKTMIFVDETGAEVAGTVVEEEVVIDATTNDVREGKVFVSDVGVKTGEKFIPSHVVREGYTIITANSKFAVSKLGELYDFTKLQALICSYNSSVSNSVATEKVAINYEVYAVNSTESIASVTKDSTNQRIDLGFTNDSTSLYVLRYFMYKEIY